MTLLTIDEAAERLRVPVPTMRHWRAHGKGPAFFKLGKRLVCTEDDLNAYIETKRAAALAVSR